MAKLCLVLALSVLAVQSAVLKTEDGVLKRIARSPHCGFCEEHGPPPPGPPRPPPFFRTQNWSGVARSADGSHQGVFSGAAAAAGTGAQNSGEALALASAADNSGSNPAGGYNDKSGVQSGQQNFAASKSYKESKHSFHGGVGSNSDLNANQQQIQSGGFGASGAGGFGASGSGGLSSSSGSGSGASWSGESKSSRFRESESGAGGSGISGSSGSGISGFSGTGSSGFGGSNAASGSGGAGGSGFGASEAQSTSFGSNQGGSSSHYGGGFGNSHSVETVGSGGGFGHRRGLSHQRTSESSFDGGNGQQIQSSRFANQGSFSSADQNGFSSRNSQVSSDLSGALNLASQGLQTASQAKCSTCEKSSYALSNAKSRSGSAVALSIGG